MDMSDEIEMNLHNIRFFADERNADQQEQHLDKSPDEKADDMVRDAEVSKAHMFGITGRDPRLNFNYVNFRGTDKTGMRITEMYNNYQMIDMHIDESL